MFFDLKMGGGIEGEAVNRGRVGGGGGGGGGGGDCAKHMKKFSKRRNYPCLAKLIIFLNLSQRQIYKCEQSSANPEVKLTQCKIVDRMFWAL